MEGDLFHNAGFGTIYLRINDTYYRRRLAIGWERITPELAATVEKWDPMHELQKEAYLPALRAAGLID